MAELASDEAQIGKVKTTSSQGHASSVKAESARNLEKAQKVCNSLVTNSNLSLAGLFNPNLPSTSSGDMRSVKDLLAKKDAEPSSKRKSVEVLYEPSGAVS
ncbi:hypothetical protein Adt_23579 [Abeliophyllum distichum]|uniref:Uncharacterized protein n=1 Tax=Abeliophyllum distichum TaxID=126358 RepID=A0ABD1SCX9_9LAMI